MAGAPPLLYVYPQWHTVSFTLVARKHIEYIRRLGLARVYELDELAFPSYVPHLKYTAVVHPWIYVYHRLVQARLNALDESLRHRLPEYLAWWRSHYGRLVAVDVCDSDRISDYAVELLNRADAAIVPSSFCAEVYRASGVRVPVHRVPHGVDPEWYTMPSAWETAPAGRLSPALVELYLYKRRKGKRFLLFWLWHCYDEQTRVLTRSGFKYWRELTPEDEIATVNLQTGELEYQKPERIYVFDYEGETIRFRGQHYDLLVTPNHRMVVRDSYHYVRHSLGKQKRALVRHDVVDPARPWRFVHAEELYKYYTTRKSPRRFEILRACRWRGKHVEYFELPKVELDPERPARAIKALRRKPGGVDRVPMRAFLRFLGWWISEGYAKYNARNREYVIIISNTREEHVEEIVKTIEEMGFHAIVEEKSVRPGWRKCYNIIVASKRLYVALKALGLPVHPDVKGKKARLKFVPDFVKELSPDLIMEFLKALWKGDGTFTKDGEFSKYTTASRRLAEDVAELLLKCGHAVTIYREKRGERYSVCPSRRYATPTMMKPPERVHYRGKVWCVAVPNGTVIVERNGKIAVSGNSPERKGWPEVKEVYRMLAERRRDAVLALKTAPPHSTAFQEVMHLGAVQVHGWLDELDKMALYDLADITLVFSRGGGFELNCLESLARGVPCVAGYWGSWRDYLPPFLGVRAGGRVRVFPDSAIHAGHGYAVDVEDAVAKIEDILDSYAEYRARVEEWRREVLAREYRWDLIARQLASIALGGTHKF